MTPIFLQLHVLNFNTIINMYVFIRIITLSIISKTVQPVLAANFFLVEHVAMLKMELLIVL